jgi:hypothetical protein
MELEQHLGRYWSCGFCEVEVLDYGIMHDAITDAGFILKQSPLCLTVIRNG